MHNESRAEREPEPVKESKWRILGPVVFWGAVAALPAMNLASSIISYKDTKMQLELTQLKELAEAATKK